MSYANFVGDVPKGDSTRIDTLKTEKIERVSVFQNIQVEGDMDFQNSGQIVNTLGIQTPQLTTEFGTVATLDGTDMTLFGELDFENKQVKINRGDDATTLSGANVVIGDISGSVENNVVINATGVSVEAPEASAVYVKPIRQVDNGGGLQYALYYDPATGEITWSNT